MPFCHYSTIKICVFTISDNKISEEIIRAHKRNISVKVLTDSNKSFDKGSDIETIHNAGVPVKIDRTQSHMHHKFCIIDKESMLTGSYNWARSAAEQNQENIIVSDDAKMAKDFVREFDRLWENLADY
ncbi:phospholipase D-like domain-containing protein [bacterium]|nr:phospholipase D-like domain-containing protein [Vicingaceae bacterium]MDC0004828.1 phospholipase D-like domain-containing protein [bacterium]